MSKGLPVKQSIFQFVDRGNEEYTYDIMCKVERGEVSLQEAKQKYRMILDKRKAKINTAKRLSTIEGKNDLYIFHVYDICADFGLLPFENIGLRDFF